MDVILVAYLLQAARSGPRGENAGRTLAEFNIVRAYRKLSTWNGQPTRLSVPMSSLPSDASRVAILLQRVGQKEIAGAAVLSLP